MSRYLEGVDIERGLSVVYPADQVIYRVEKDLGMTLEEFKTSQDFQKALLHCVTRCPNVYSSRSQNAFLTVDRTRMIADFENGYITDINQNVKMKIVSNEMIDGVRRIGVLGILLPLE